jgi:hypothetical protein
MPDIDIYSMLERRKLIFLPFFSMNAIEHNKNLKNLKFCLLFFCVCVFSLYIPPDYIKVKYHVFLLVWNQLYEMIQQDLKVLITFNSTVLCVIWETTLPCYCYMINIYLNETSLIIATWLAQLVVLDCESGNQGSIPRQGKSLSLLMIVKSFQWSYTLYNCSSMYWSNQLFLTKGKTSGTLKMQIHVLAL